MRYIKRGIFPLVVSFLLLGKPEAKPEIEVNQKPEASVDLTLPKGMFLYVCYEGDTLWKGDLPLMGYSYPEAAPINNICTIKVRLYVDKRGRLLVHCKQSLAGLEGKERADVSLYYPVDIKGEYKIGNIFEKKEEGKDLIYKCKVVRGTEVYYVRLNLTNNLEKLKNASNISIYAVGWKWKFWDVSTYQNGLIKKKSK